MVVRATISAVVYRLPFSDRIPQRFKTVLAPAESPITSIEISPDEVRPLVTPSQKIRMKMLEKRSVDLTPGRMYANSTRNPPSDLENDSDATVKETDAHIIRQARVESYLAEQHDEFTTLINKNLKEVMQQQQKTPDEASWRRLVLELAMARSGEEATSKFNTLFNRAQDSVCSYVPFVSRERHTRGLLAEYENSALKMEYAELLDSLDYDSKVILLRQLMVDLGMRADADDIINFTRGHSVSEDSSVTDKIELLALLGVRLSFISMRYFFPLSQLMYTKFKENDILLVNNKNFSRFLTVLVRMMEAIEDKFNPQVAAELRPESHASTETEPHLT